MPNDMERSVKPEHSKVAAAFPFLFEADQPTSLVESDQDVEAFGHDDEAQPQAIAYRSDFFQKRVMMVIDVNARFSLRLPQPEASCVTRASPTLRGFRARKRHQADDRSCENETGERRLGGAAVRWFALMKCGGSTSYVIALRELLAICVAAEF